LGAARVREVPIPSRTTGGGLPTTGSGRDNGDGRKRKRMEMRRTRRRGVVERSEKREG